MNHKSHPKQLHTANEKMGMQKCQINSNNPKSQSLKIPFFLRQSNRYQSHTLPDQFTHSSQKMPMQKCQLNKYDSLSKQLKIPFFNLQHMQCTKYIKQQNKSHKKQKQYTDILIKELENFKRKTLVKEIQGEKKSSGLIVTIESKIGLNRYRIKQLTQLTPDINLKERILTQQDQQKGNKKYYMRNKREKMKTYLPTLHLKNLPMQTRKKSYGLRDEYQRQRSQIKQKKITQCYVTKKQPSRQNSSRNLYPFDRSTSRKKVRTQQQIQNQYLLERILTVQPSKQLRKDKLDQNFSQHQHYKKIRSNKSARNSSLGINRSRTQIFVRRSQNKQKN